MKPKPIQTNASHGKRLFSFDAGSFEQITEVTPEAPRFGLLLACDARGLSAETVGSVAKALYARGLCYLCVWGPDCERVHDIFDEVGAAIDRFVMTTWHKNEPIEEAAWFFISCAIPGEQAGPADGRAPDWIAISVRNSTWLRQMETALGTSGV